MNTSKHHGKIREISVIASLLLMCTGVWSCKDVYPYDDQEPTWLGASIYDYLQNSDKGSFTYFLRVIDDLDYTEVLSKTGSKTLFVADDEAFMKGIKEQWGLTSYDQLSDAQKKIILYNSMLDNAYLLEMMSSSAASSTSTEPQEGRCLRQVTSSNIVDSIGHFSGSDLPQNNKDWDVFREKGVRLALDATNTYMVHFLEEQLYQNDITLSDLEWLFNHRYSGIRTNDAFIFDKIVVDQNVTCKNGYVHQLDGLLIPPSNMAEEIRRNPSTKLFSRLLDRFSVPVYNATLTADYNRIYHYQDDANAERVYEKRYYTTQRNRNTGYSSANDGFLKYTDIDNKEHNAKGSLFFDPGWNAFTSGTGGSADVDMGAMFIPNDETLYDYFFTPEGTGKALIDRYGWRADGTPCSIPEEAMDSIPLDVIQALVRNVMKTSFIATVPSKFESIMNDARESMDVYTDDIDKCIVANNGVVYVMNKVYSPARYVAVMAPVMLSESTSITNWAINQYEYDKYLLAMDSYFSLVVPTNDAMRYNDPSTLKEATPTAYIFRFDTKAKSEASKVYAETWTYDKQTGELLTQGSNLTAAAQIKNLLTQMMEYYIVVGDFQDGNKYHMAKGYGSIKVKTGNEVDRKNRPIVERIYGGHEIEIDTIPGVDTGIEVATAYNQENGNTYFISQGMIQPATQSVYKVLSDSINHPEFSEFFHLCEYSDDVVQLVAARDEKGNEIPDSTKKFKIFENLGGLDYNVRTFNTYHYTVYVPTNDKIQDAYDRGLPSWTDLEIEAEAINEEINDLTDLKTNLSELQDQLSQFITTGDTLSQSYLNKKKEVETLTAEVDAKDLKIANEKKVIEQKAMLIVDFTKYHIQDNSVYVDELPHCLVEGNNTYYVVDYETASLDNETKRFCKVTVQTTDGPIIPGSSHTTLSIKGDYTDSADDNGYDPMCYVVNVDNTEGHDYNIMTRDIEFSGKTISTSSYAVVHQINNFLVNDRIFKGGKFTWINE